MNIVIHANALHTNTLTGGDKIFVECARRWIAGHHYVVIVTNEAGIKYCRDNGIPKKNLSLWRMSWFDRFGVKIAMPVKMVIAFAYAVVSTAHKPDIVFASSFFLPDSLPALVFKLHNPSARLVTAFYVFAQGKWGSGYSGGKFKGFFFYLNERIALFILQRFQGKVLTASAYDRKRFSKMKHFNIKNVMAIRGGVDNAFFASVPGGELRYDAVFVGRFHPQKCVDDLIGIWQEIVKHDQRRTLALVGGGLQESKLRDLVAKYGLEKNIVFMGIRDGIEKVNILKSSRMFVSASRFDTGNIALDEALACGVPGIVYDLPHLDYPKGVMKIPVGNRERFISAILDLLIFEPKRKRLGKKAQSFARTIDWEVKTKLLTKFLTSDSLIRE